MSTKGRDTSMKEKRGRSPTLPRKAGIRQQQTTRGRSPTLPQKAGIGQQETRGRSPSLPRKTETGQRGRSLTPSSILERKRTSTSLESRKVPTIPWPSATVSRGTSTRNPKKQVSPPKTKSLRRPLDKPTLTSKVLSTKSKSNPKNITTSSLKTSGSIKPKSSVTSRSPLKLKNSLNIKETKASSKKLPTKNGLGSMAIKKKPIMSSSQNDHNIVTHEEDNHILHGEVKFENHNIGLVSEISCEDNVLFDGSVDNKHAYDHDDCRQNDQSEETIDIINDHLNHSIADQENQESENEQVEEETDVGSIDDNGEAKDEDIEAETNLEEPEDVEEAEPEDPEQHEETKPDELEIEENYKPNEHEETDIEEDEEEEDDERKPEIKEDDVEVPEEEDTRSEVVMKNPEVVMHGKKDSATYNDVIEETVSKLREQRKNRVLALAGAFETVISLESDVSPKDLSPRNI